ncbi:hypothetical protein GWK47_001944 [Chionoecetes opilio]|uniref:Uncharacterized protein n=1 Tax=Chionoecetes opilio TaxID=41210 RepID=A0A8J5BYL5_CHIOP|nr:hypothetical protein GWK47_001944 [Chionoecetes opilio]
MFPTVSLWRGIHEGPSITESFEDSNVRTRGRAEAGFEDILEDHLVDMIAAGNQSKLRPSSCSIRMQAPCTMPVFEAVVSKQKAMILSLPLASSNLLQDHCSHFFLPVEPGSLPGRKKELGIIFPCEEDGDAVLLSPERDGRSFPSQCRTNLSGISCFRSCTIFSAAFSLPPIRARWTVLFETAILPMSIQELER